MLIGLWSLWAEQIGAALGATDSEDTTDVSAHADVSAYLSADEVLGTGVVASHLIEGKFAGFISGGLSNGEPETEGQDIAAFTAAAIASSSFALTEATDTAAMSAVAIVSGALAATDAPDVTAFSTAVVVSSSIAATEAQDVAAISAVAIISSALAATEAADVTAIATHVLVASALAATDAQDIVEFSAELDSSERELVLDATEAPDQCLVTIGESVTVFRSRVVSVTAEPKKQQTFEDERVLFFRIEEAPDTCQMSAQVDWEDDDEDILFLLEAA